MFNLSRVSVVGIAIVPFLFLVGSGVQASTVTYSFSELESELATLSDGIIQAKSDLPDTAKESTFDKKKTTFFTDENPSSIDPQDYFSVDVDKFNASNDASDFLAAKQNFYSRLNFNSKKQRYDRPYAYLESWRSLAHPQIKTLTLPLTTYDETMVPFKDGQRANDPSPYFDATLNRSIDAISESELTQGNDLDLLLNNDSFEHKLDLIRRAKKSFLGIVMVLSCDENGTRMVDELIKAKQRGVDVKMMHEKVWTVLTNAACLHRMRKAGIDVLLVSDMISNHFAFGVMHNKFWIRDEEEAIIGGQNMVDAETQSDGFNARMHDADVWIHSGPEVTTLEWQYANLWHRYAKTAQAERIVPYLTSASNKKDQERTQGVRGEKNYETWFADPSIRMKGVCRSVVQKYGKEDRIGPVLQKYVEVATMRISATTPTVAYHDKKGGSVINDLLNALTKKASEGVAIDVIANGIDGIDGALGVSLQKMIQQAKSNAMIWSVPLLKAVYSISDIGSSKSDLKGLKRFQDSAVSIRAWTYTSFIHAKQMVFDRKLVAVGSFNLDTHSAQTNHETEIFCLDDKLAGQMDQSMTRDLVNSVPVRR